jgi:predicted RNA-binding Zn-ribbon protein involved in translation (DUF1610 family)
MSDRSLDDFLSDSDEGTDEADDPDSDPAAADSEVDDTDVEPLEADESTVNPAVATATVSPDGTVCPSCGETVRRCWHDDGAYVCRECKEW